MAERSYRAGHTCDEALVVTRLLEHGATHYPESSVLSLGDAGPERLGFAALAERAGRLGALLAERGIGRGDAVASLALNGHRHLELYLAVPALGAVLHTVNVRLGEQQAASVLAEGGARLLFADPELEGQARRIAAAGPPLTVLGEPYEAALPARPLAAWPELEESDACMLCHTSGTSGRPRGVLYSHRGICLHAAMLARGDVYGLGEEDVAMPVVPMFHAAAWGIPYAAWQAGADLVLPGAQAGDPARLLDLIEAERVTFMAAVPTVWSRLLDEQRRSPRDVSSLRAAVSGGAALPAALAQRAIELLEVDLWQGWGMTETGPLVTLSKVPPARRQAPPAKRAEILASQGRAVAGARLRLAPLEGGAPVELAPGRSGEILARAPWTACRYLDEEADPDRFEDGWVRSGDIARVDERGSLHIVDRVKDLIKSGGEWISSLELEAALVACSGVREAAAVAAVADPEWGERPVAFLVLEQRPPSLEDVRAELATRVPRWWLPDRFVVCDEIARTSVGKYDKRALRRSLASRRVELG